MAATITTTAAAAAAKLTMPGLRFAAAASTEPSERPPTRTVARRSCCSVIPASFHCLPQNQGVAFLVCLDEPHRDQDGPRPDEANPYPDVLRLAVPIHEK